jgi:hypothetical protein
MKSPNSPQYERRTRIGLIFSLTLNAITFFGTLVVAILSHSGFLGVSALVSFLSLMTKLIAFLQFQGKSNLGSHKAFGLMALTVSFGAICYLAYMARLFFFPKVATYNLYEGLAIAAFAFGDLAYAIVSLLKNRRNPNLVLIGLKCGALSNGLTAIVLAQIAILAFTNPGVDYSFDNALAGMVFGGLDLLIGIAMIIGYFRTKKKPTPSV